MPPSGVADGRLVAFKLTFSGGGGGGCNRAASRPPEPRGGGRSGDSIEHWQQQQLAERALIRNSGNAPRGPPAPPTQNERPDVAPSRLLESVSRLEWRRLLSRRLRYPCPCPVSCQLLQNSPAETPPPLMAPAKVALQQQRQQKSNNNNNTGNENNAVVRH